jgi:hypothetical protein
VSFEVKRHIVHSKSTDVAKEHVTSIFRVEVKAKQANRRWATQSKALLHADFLLFKLKDAGDMFLRNVG